VQPQGYILRPLHFNRTNFDHANSIIRSIVMYTTKFVAFQTKGAKRCPTQHGHRPHCGGLPYTFRPDEWRKNLQHAILQSMVFPANGGMRNLHAPFPLRIHRHTDMDGKANGMHFALPCDCSL
jgi:hypothetical protein